MKSPLSTTGGQGYLHKLLYCYLSVLQNNLHVMLPSFPSALGLTSLSSPPDCSLDSLTVDICKHARLPVSEALFQRFGVSQVQGYKSKA